MQRLGLVEWLAVAFSALVLAGCSGGGGDDSPGGNPGNNQQYTIGGTLSGLNGTVVLQNNGGNNLSLTANGPFTFTTALASGAAYAVTVLTQPAGQTCNVTTGSGTANANVSSVAVSCTTNPTSITISGTVIGLTAGSLVLQNNLGDNLTVTTDTFTFPTAVAANSPYFVSVLIQPTTLTCTVTANGSGTSAANVTNVQVTCVDNATTTVTVGGQVSGLGGGGTLTLRNAFLANNVVTTNDLQITTNGTFTFPAMPSRSFFTVTVLAQPTGQTCSVFANGGSPVANVTNVVVDCQNGTTVHTVGGTISGLTKAGLILTISANNNILVVPSGATQFTFPIGLIPDTEYLVGIAVQPPGMTCVATNVDGAVGTANVTDVAIACINNTTAPLIGTYKVAGINDFITLYPDGTYVLASRENDPSCGPSNGNGVELGVYNYNSTTGAFAVVSNSIDTNGDCGLWDGSGASGTVQKTGVGQGSSLTYTDGPDTFTLTPVASIANTFIGAFRQPGSTAFAVIGDDGHYTIAHTGNDSAGIEYGCYVLTGTSSGTLTPDVTPATCPGTVDTNDDAGLSDADGTALPYMILNPYVVQAVDRLFVRIVPN